tara:strand:- start:2575 stop:2886 length:312 start_codon:yes stop_codon:yes gene_type:complete
MSIVIGVGDRKMLHRWIGATYPELTVAVAYRGLYIYNGNETPDPESLQEPYILVRNDRYIVSYNPETGRTYKQKGPMGHGWRHRLKKSLAVKFEKLWGIENDR